MGEHLEALRRMIDKTMVRDYEERQPSFTPIWSSTSPRGSRTVGEWRGRDASATVKRIILDHWDQDMGSIRYWECDDVVFSHRTIEWKAKTTGKTVTTGVVELFEFTDGDDQPHHRLHHGRRSGWRKRSSPSAERLFLAQAPTARWTSETNRSVDRPTKLANPARCSLGQTSAQLVVGHDPMDGGGEPERLLARQEESGVTNRLGNGGDGIGRRPGHRGHRLDERHAEPLVVRRAHKDVGRLVVGLHARTGERAGHEHRIVKFELVDNAASGRAVALAQRRTHEVQTSKWVRRGGDRQTAS